ncbi:MAG: alpha/beta fold hydrolase [Phenylobacterium sp.]|uniref:alpha/beta fold hydrolase n=1 Tax=Phenylobacterium sp. TaxID=1871053 RepID=UPI0027372471|nr:alpha/beta fold hydrolase [Phenylobacterium sp.]MDP3174146.1 alpha/beta fold hydrolase [Phenylobacterium sp.]
MLDFESTSRRCEIEGATILYNEAGDGPPLLCFHGGGAGANAWDNTKWNIDVLSKSFRVLLINLPGYGGSSHLEALPGETQEALFVRAICAVMDKLGIERANFYGTSMSAAAVIYLANKFPVRVFKVVLKSPAAGRTFLTVTPADGIEALNAFKEEPSREKMVRIMRLFVPNNDLLTEDMIELRYKSAMDARAMPQPRQQHAGNVDIRPVMEGLTVPVLLLWGHQDRMVPLDGALSALSMIPDIRVHIWGGGVGHFIEFERPAEFNRVVTDFLLH